MKKIALEDILFEAFQRYYRTLENYGSKDQKSVNSLIVLSWVINFIKKFRNRLKCEDIKAINEMLSCLYGSNCLIPYPKELLVDGGKE